MTWPQDPYALLAGPRGRRLCWAQVTGTALPGWPQIGAAWQRVWMGQADPGGPGAGLADLAGELAAAVGRAGWREALADMSETALVDPLAESATAAMYWQPPDEVDRALAIPELASELRPVAAAVTGMAAARWWSGGIDLDRQAYLDAGPGERGGPPLSGAAKRLAAWRAAAAQDERRSADRPADVTAPCSGRWWSSPIFGPVCTTRSLPGLGALRIFAVEDWPGWEDVLCWPVAVSRPVRIYEIAGPADWSALVARYPREVTMSRRHDWWKVTGWAGRWLMPDYAAVAADYDAVHLSVGGYLTTAGRALAVDDARCLLAGWDPDATYWLSDALASAGPPSRWIREDAAPGWRRAGQES